MMRWTAEKKTVAIYFPFTWNWIATARNKGPKRKMNRINFTSSPKTKTKQPPFTTRYLPVNEGFIYTHFRTRQCVFLGVGGGVLPSLPRPLVYCHPSIHSPSASLWMHASDIWSFEESGRQVTKHMEGNLSVILSPFWYMQRCQRN